MNLADKSRKDTKRLRKNLQNDPPNGPNDSSDSDFSEDICTSEGKIYVNY